MAKVLICCDIDLSRDSKIHDTLSTFSEKLRTDLKVEVSVAASALQAQTFLRLNTYKILLLWMKEGPSPELINVLSKTRNFCGQRDLSMIALLTKPGSSGIQKSLMLGAKEILIEPVDPRKIIWMIRNILENIPLHAGLKTETYPLPKWPTKVQVFGRLGKIYLDPPGDIQLESDLILKPGQRIAIRHQVAVDFNCSSFFYEVQNGTKNNIYYSYANSYYLRWLSEPAQLKQFDSWLRHKERQFAVPKTKVLYIGDSTTADLGAAFDETQFSLYVRSQHNLDSHFLHRISAPIVVADELQGAAASLIQTWAAADSAKRFFISTVSNPMPGWMHLPFSNAILFRPQFENAVAQFLAERIASRTAEARFFNRKSNYSRCAITLEGEAIAMSRSELRIQSPYDFEKNSLIQLGVSELADPRGFGLYGKVLSTEHSRTGAGFLTTCEMIPTSDQRNPAVTELIDKLDLKSEINWANRPKNVAALPEPFFLTTREGLRDLAKAILIVGLLLTLGVLIYQFLPRPEIRSSPPASLQNVFRAIRNAFQ